MFLWASKGYLDAWEMRNPYNVPTANLNINFCAAAIDKLQDESIGVEWGGVTETSQHSSE